MSEMQTPPNEPAQGDCGAGFSLQTGRLKPAPQGPSSSWRWPAIVIGLLAAHFILMMVTVMIATRDRSFAVMPKYYEQALAWDQTQAKKRESEKLGWTFGIETGTKADPLGKRHVVCTLADAQGQPLKEAVAEISYYHRTFAQEIHKELLATTAPGRFEKDLPMRRSGFWEFRVSIKADGREFVTDRTHFVEDAR